MIWGQANVLRLLVLHLVRDEPGYGNELIQAIERITEGAITVNPNTMYPLLRELESEGCVEGRWEHPDKRTRRYYSITASGRAEHERLAAEVRPALDEAIRSASLIKRELYPKQ